MKGEMVEFDNLRFPVMASPKIDGHRLVTDPARGALSSSLKPFRNDFIRQTLSAFPWLDGEVVVEGQFNEVTSALSKASGTPDFKFHVFDHLGKLQDPFFLRYERYRDLQFPNFILPVQQICVKNSRELEKLAEKWRPQYPEGIIVRDPRAPYKFGRSTAREGWLGKFKYLEEIECEIIGFVERYHNTNEAKVSELGLTKRSSAKAGKVPAGDLGAFVCFARDRFTEKFEVGTGDGLTLKLRKEIWQRKERFLGKIITIRYQDLGSKDKPRQPIFVRFRESWDITDY